MAIGCPSPDVSARVVAAMVSGPRWVALGALLATTWNLLTTLAHQRGWSPGQLSSLAFVGHGVDLTAVVLAAAGGIIGIRSGILALRRPPSAQE